MKNKKVTIFIVCLLIIMVIVGIVLKIQNDKKEREKIIAEEKKQVTTVLSDVIIKKLAKKQSGYNIDEIQAKMDEEAGQGKTTVYRFEDDIIIQFVETNNKYKINDFVNKKTF